MTNLDQLKDRLEQHTANVLFEQADNQRPPGDLLPAKISDFNARTFDFIFEQAWRAISSTRSGDTSGTLVPISAPTGSGKTRTAMAMAVGLYRADPDSSVTIVQELVRQCDQTYTDLLELMPNAGAEDLVVWSSAHCVNATEQTIAKYFPDSPPAARYRKEDMKNARVVITTHSQLQQELKSGNDNGVAKYKGKLRDVVFIDETPAMVKPTAATPGQVYRLAEVAALESGKSALQEGAMSAFTKMQELSQAERPAQFLASPPLVSFNDLDALSVANVQNLLESYSCRGLSVQEKLQLHDTARFLRASSDGYCFMSTAPDNPFLAFELEFRPHSNFVLLDATVDIHGLIPLLQGGPTFIEPPPPVSYTNLDWVHVVPPKDFQQKKRALLKDVTSAKSYGRWMRECVLDHTKPGDFVLVVSYKDVFHRYKAIDPAPSADTALDWEGRKVCTTYWGVGVGSNEWKDCTHVFLFGAPYRPRSTYVGTALALTETKAADADLSKQSGNRLTGDALTVAEGDVCRWIQQMAFRGNGRNFDDCGVAGEMKLFTVMDIVPILPRRKRMFPGASLPRRVCYDTEVARGPAGRLIELMMDETTPDFMPSAEVGRRLRIQPHQLSRTFKRQQVSCYASEFGWELVASKRLGKPGKGLWLVRTSYLESLDAQDGRDAA